MKITLREITNDNFKEVLALSSTLPAHQQKLVAPNVYSLAEAYVNSDTLWPRAIYLEETAIGFIMVSLRDEQVKQEDMPVYFIWRLMIAKEYQNQGYGKTALEEVIKKCREDNIKTLYTSCDISGEEPYRFYINCGFIDTGENDGEQILKLHII